MENKNLRENLIYFVEEDESMITIMKPMSGMFSGRLLVIFEDAFGEVDTKIMTIQGIMKNYLPNSVTKNELELFLKGEEVIEEN